MNKKIRIKQVVAYGGHQSKSNGSISLTLKADYGELVNTLQLCQLFSNDVTIKAKISNGKPKKIGIFRLNKIVIDGDGESIIKFDGLKDHIETGELNEFPTSDSDVKVFSVMYESEVEVEVEGG